MTRSTHLLYAYDESFPAGIYLVKVTMKASEQCVKYVQIYSYICFIHCSVVSIVDFEQVNVDRVREFQVIIDKLFDKSFVSI